MPQELITALKNINFSNKTIRVFTTHEGSGIGNVLEEIKNICLGAHVLTDALAIKGSECKSSREVVERWLKNI